MEINTLIKPPRIRPITIRLPADLHQRLQAAQARLQALGYRLSLQAVAVAALRDAAGELEKAAAEAEARQERPSQGMEM